MSLPKFLTFAFTFVNIFNRFFNIIVIIANDFVIISKVVIKSFYCQSCAEWFNAKIFAKKINISVTFRFGFHYTILRSPNLFAIFTWRRGTDRKKITHGYSLLSAKNGCDSHKSEPEQSKENNNLNKISQRNRHNWERLRHFNFLPIGNF